MVALNFGTLPPPLRPPPPRLDFAAINAAALRVLPDLCARWLPGGRRIGREWVCASLRGGAGGSCKVHLQRGLWADFATDQRGGDVISFAAAVHGIGQAEAARRLASMLGMSGGADGRAS